MKHDYKILPRFLSPGVAPGEGGQDGETPLQPGLCPVHLHPLSGGTGLCKLAPHALQLHRCKYCWDSPLWGGWGRKSHHGVHICLQYLFQGITVWAEPAVWSDCWTLRQGRKPCTNLKDPPLPPHELVAPTVARPFSKAGAQWAPGTEKAWKNYRGESYLLVAHCPGRLIQSLRGESSSWTLVINPESSWPQEVMRPNYSVGFQKEVVVQVEKVASSLDKGSKSARIVSGTAGTEEMQRSGGRIKLTVVNF